MKADQWQPSCTIDFLNLRAQVLQEIRAFFSQRGVLEVDTPILNPYSGAECHVEPFEISGQFLHTSPEWAMKRLLAAGSGPIYQICKVFRKGERGRLHNPEFTLIEWYRPDITYRDLMLEVETLLCQVLEVSHCDHIRYQEIFANEFGIDPFQAKLDTLTKHIRDCGIQLSSALESIEQGLDLLFAHIQPKLAKQRPIFIYDFPLCQASYGKIRQDVSERFEVIYRGLELANGYSEIEKAQELIDRHEQYNKKRSKPIPLDPLSIAALQAKKCQSAGVAVGLDRLLMTKFQLETIDFVMTFPARQI